MNNRMKRLATGVLAVAAVVLMAERSWAIRQGLPPSKDEWGLKYDVAVEEANSDTLTVVFTLEDEGRLKPLYSIDVVAFSKQTDSQGGRAYDVLEPIKMEKTADGKLVGRVQFPKQFVDQAKVRLISLTVNGRRQPSGGVFYDIPIAKFWKNAPGGDAPLATPPSRKVRK